MLSCDFGDCGCAMIWFCVVLHGISLGVWWFGFVLAFGAVGIDIWVVVLFASAGFVNLLAVLVVLIVAGMPWWFGGLLLF